MKVLIQRNPLTILYTLFHKHLLSLSVKRSKITMKKNNVLIAGGTGLVGEELVNKLRKAGCEVRVLTRQESDVKNGFYNWDIKNKKIDSSAFEGVDTVINLAGAGIADKKWTDKRKKELIDSRVEPTLFLASEIKKHKQIKQYISASGINCYGYENHDKLYREDDPYGKDFLSHVVQLWEDAAKQMPDFVDVSILRTSVVLTAKGGALPKIAKPVKFGIGSALGSGNQWMPWITLDDLTDAFIHLMDNRKTGTYNALAGYETNKEFTKKLAKALKKPFWFPNVPAFALKLMLGEMSSMLLQGLKASNKKLKNTGFKFKHEELKSALEEIYER